VPPKVIGRVVGGWPREILAIFDLEILGELEISLNACSTLVNTWSNEE